MSSKKKNKKRRRLLDCMGLPMTCANDAALVQYDKALYALTTLDLNMLHYANRALELDRSMVLVSCLLVSPLLVVRNAAVICLFFLTFFVTVYFYGVLVALYYRVSPGRRSPNRPRIPQVKLLLSHIIYFLNAYLIKYIDPLFFSLSYPIDFVGVISNLTTV